MAGSATQQPLGVVAKRPAIPLAAALVLGILLHPLLPPHPLLLPACIGALSLAALLSLSKPWICPGLLLLDLVLCGIGLGQREHFQFASTDVGLFSSDEAHLAQVELQIIDEPRIVADPIGQTRGLPPRQMFQARVLKIKTWNGWVPASGELPVTADQPNPRLNAAQIIRAFGMLERPSPAANPGQFDWAVYYRQQRILTTLTVTRLGNIQILDDPGLSPLMWLRSETSHLLATGFTAAHGVDEALLAALLLGSREPQLSSIIDEFKDTGVAYQLNVSGMHIAILAAFVLLLCRLLFLRPRISLVITELFVLLYGVIALPSHSGIRSVILCSAIFLAKWTRRPTDKFQLLAACVITMLLYHPLDLYSLGFLLSFAAVFGLALLGPKLQTLLSEFQDVHVLLAPGTTPTPVQLVKNRVRTFLWSLVRMTIVVWASILPLVLYFVGKVNPWSLLGGIVVLPIALVALLGGLLKVLFTLLWPGMAACWAIFAGWPIIWMRHIVDLLAKLPGGQLEIPAPPIWLIVLYYILLLLPVLSPATPLKRRRRWVLRAAPVFGVIAILLLPSFPRITHFANPAELRVTLLSVGAGQCAVIEPPGGEPIVFDAGSTSISDVMEKVIQPFLRTRGQPRVDEIFLSHGDYDHISAAGDLAATYGVHAVFISPHFRRNAVGNQPDQQLLETLDKLNLTPRVVQTASHFDLSGEAHIDVLWPPESGQWNSNNAGLVLRLTYAGETILFPADIQDPAFEGLLKHPEELKADILIAAHHGSSEPLTPAFLRAVNPRFILSSNAWVLTNKQKSFDRMAGQTPLYRTSKYGAITVEISKDGKISLSTFLSPSPAGRGPG